MANGIDFSDRFARMGAQLIREAASATALTAGDGTTTATVLAQAIYTEGAKLIAAGVDPMVLRRGMSAAVKAVLTSLEQQSKPVSTEAEVATVATVSANGDAAMGSLVANAIERVGKDGVVLVEAGSSMETTLDVALGMEIERGYLSSYFIKDNSLLNVTFTKPLILVYEGKLSHAEPLIPLLEKVAGAGRALLLIADVAGEALTMLVANCNRGLLEVCAVRPPGFGDARVARLEDVATLVGTFVQSETSSKRLENLDPSDLGTAERVTVSSTTTTIVGGNADAESLRQRINQVQTEVGEAEPSSAAPLRTRLAQLAGGVAVIKVGAFTEVEMTERCARYEDALQAARAAIKEGVVPGGGVALIHAASAVTALSLFGEERLGADVIRRAIEEPLRRIAQNAGVEGGVILDQVRHSASGVGYNAATGHFEDLLAAGVVDPTQVVRVALQNAASVASMLLTTAVSIAQAPGPKASMTQSEAQYG